MDDSDRTAEKVLEEYRKGRLDFRGIDIEWREGSGFRDGVLEGANFSGAWICADFAGANLRACRFVGSNVKTCAFDRADLRDADFSGAAIDGATFLGARLEGARFDAPAPDGSW